MSFFLGIYDSDTIDSAFGRQSKNMFRGAEIRTTGAEQRSQLRQDWADLVDKFSWRVQPSAPGQAFGIN